jgi:hypothetical protein
MVATYPAHLIPVGMYNHHNNNILYGKEFYDAPYAIFSNFLSTLRSLFDVTTRGSYSQGPLLEPRSGDTLIYFDFPQLL